MLSILLLLVALAPPPALVVSIQDANGAPLSGVQVTILDRSGRTVLARAATDAAGAASFATLPAGEVRVAVAGQIQGVWLRQVSGDSAGVLVILGPPPTTLALVAESDGLVAPDPAMVAPDFGVAIATKIPTAALAATATPEAPATPRPTMTPAPARAPATGEPNEWLILLGIVLAAALTLACGILPSSLARGRQR